MTWNANLESVVVVRQQNSTMEILSKVWPILQFRYCNMILQIMFVFEKSYGKRKSFGSEQSHEDEKWLTIRLSLAAGSVSNASRGFIGYKKEASIKAKHRLQ